MELWLTMPAGIPLPDLDSLQGKVAIVTGAAGGIGAATAAALARRGASVVVADIDHKGAEATASSIRDAGHQAVGRYVDVGEEASIDQLMMWVDQHLGPVRVLHNNAAAMSDEVLGRDGELVDLDTEVWDRTLAVNVRGAMLGCKHAIRRMLASGGGSIINTSSVAGRVGDARFVAYGVSKAGIDSLTRCVATSYGKEGIRCNAVAPGLVLTPTALRNLSEDAIRHAMERHLTTRPGGPGDIANVVAFLASDESEFINGQIIYADGGVTAH